MAKNTVTIILVIVGILLVANYFGGTTTTPTTSDTGNAALCPYTPTAQWSAKDKFSSTSIPTASGTAYYKQNGLIYTTSAPSGLNNGQQYSFWLLNDSDYFVQPATITAGCGNNVITAQAWQNASVTLHGYDKSTLQDDGVANVTLGANGVANIEITYQGTAKKSAAPFGGVMVVEYNSSISSVTCSGAGLTSSNPYHLTYTVTSLANTATQFGFDGTLDDGSGARRSINCQFQNGASAVGAEGAYYYVKFYPANYYLAQTGEVVLDTEKFANADTTRTAFSYNPTLTLAWS